MTGLSKQVAKHFREVFVGGNWTSVNLKQTLEGINWQQAGKSVDDCNSIAVLVFHINYYVSAVLKVLEGEALDASDKLSFNLPTVTSEAAWQQLQQKALADAEKFACLIEQFPDEKLNEIFVAEKYGTYYRNLHGIIEHTHYHLGQIALLKKMILNAKDQ